MRSTPATQAPRLGLSHFRGLLTEVEVQVLRRVAKYTRYPSTPVGALTLSWVVDGSRSSGLKAGCEAHPPFNGLWLARFRIFFEAFQDLCHLGGLRSTPATQAPRLGLSHFRGLLTEVEVQVLRRVAKHTRYPSTPVGALTLSWFVDGSRSSDLKAGCAAHPLHKHAGWGSHTFVVC